MTTQIKPPRHDVVICLGKSLTKNNHLDRILKGRVDKAVSLGIKYQIPVILSGGKSYKLQYSTYKSEATHMYKYAASLLGSNKVKLIKESKGQSTIHQLCIIKNSFLLPNNWTRVCLVTDQIHIKRATITAEWIFGDRFTIIPYGSETKLKGDKKSKYLVSEKTKYLLTLKGIINKFVKGDDMNILRLDQKIRSDAKKFIKSGGDPKIRLESLLDKY